MVDALAHVNFMSHVCISAQTMSLVLSAFFDASDQPQKGTTKAKLLTTFRALHFMPLVEVVVYTHVQYVAYRLCTKCTVYGIQVMH